jgi:hypothetical protein
MPGMRFSVEVVSAAGRSGRCELAAAPHRLRIRLAGDNASPFHHGLPDGGSFYIPVVTGELPIYDDEVFHMNYSL